MKKKLIVLYEENKTNPKNTWSGTSYQLREALKDYYDVVFIDSHDTYLIKLLKMLSKKIEKRTASLVIKPLYEKLHEIEINNRLKNYRDIPVLEICENVIVKNDYYLYRDMSYACYSYVLDKLRNDNHDYGHGMLNSISSKALTQRIKREEKIQEQAKATFFMGHWVVDLMKQYYPSLSNKFIYAGGGLNTEFIVKEKNNKNDDIKRILFVGIDFKRKGGELLLKAFKLLRNKYNKKVELIVAGPNIIKKENGINYVGKVDRDELSNLFSSCDAYCMPSRFEAYGLVFIEALCYGLPIVAYNDFEMKYFVQSGTNGFLINNYDENELCDCLEKTLFTSNVKYNVEKNMNHYLDVYSWKSVSNRIREVVDVQK